MNRALVTVWMTVLMLVGCGDEEARREAVRPPNVLLYVVDTLRADSLALYGGEKTETPALDLLAQGAVVFERAYAPSSWTRASITSLLTGLHPNVHGTQTRSDVVSDELVLLPEIFSQHGYRTAAIVTNPNVGVTYGFDQGFDEFIELFGRRERRMVNDQKARSAKAADVEFVDSDEVTKRAIEWIDGGTDPFFLFILTIDPHWPYAPPDRFDRHAAGYSGRVDGNLDVIYRKDLLDADRERLRSLYHGEIAFNDDSLGRLLAHLRAVDLFESTALYITSDHGEEFWDHGQVLHGRTLYEEVIRIPLVVRHPGAPGAATRVTEPVESIDVATTLLALAELPIPHGLDGQSLIQRSLNETRPIYSSLDLDDRQFESIIDPPWKLIRNTRSGGIQLFNLEVDPHERVNLHRKHPKRVRKLSRLLSERALQGKQRRKALQLSEAKRQVHDSELSESELDRLKALGYIREE